MNGSAAERGRTIARQQEECVEAVHRRPAGDVDEAAGGARPRLEPRTQRVRQQVGHVLQSKPHGQHGKRRRNLAIDRGGIAAQILRPQLQQIRVHAAQEGVGVGRTGDPARQHGPPEHDLVKRTHEK